MTARGVIQSRLQLAIIGLTIACLTPACRRTAEQLQTAEPFAVGVSLSTNVIHVGDVIRLTLTAVHPRDYQMTPPEIGRGKEIVVRNQTEKTKAEGTNNVRTTLSYEFTSFVVSNHTISTGAVIFAKQDGTTVQRPFPRTQFAVQTLLLKPDVTPRDIKGLVNWPAVLPRWVLPFLTVLILLLVVAVLLRRFISKRRTILQYPPPPPPHEVALRALRHLLSKGLIEAGEVEAFYVELSTIVRRYLEDRFNLRAPERTTEEFIREATSSRLLSADHQMLTRDFLEQCDLVKFARYRPEQEAMRSGYDAAERLVTETIPPPPPQEAKA